MSKKRKAPVPSLPVSNYRTVRAAVATVAQLKRKADGEAKAQTIPADFFSLYAKPSSPVTDAESLNDKISEQLDALNAPAPAVDSAPIAAPAPLDLKPIAIAAVAIFLGVFLLRQK